MRFRAVEGNVTDQLHRSSGEEDEEEDEDDGLGGGGGGCLDSVPELITDAQNTQTDPPVEHKTYATGMAITDWTRRPFADRMFRNELVHFIDLLGAIELDPLTHGGVFSAQRAMERSARKLPYDDAFSGEQRDLVTVVIDNSASCKNYLDIFYYVVEFAHKMDLVDVWRFPNMNNRIDNVKPMIYKNNQFVEQDESPLGAEGPVIVLGDYDGGPPLVRASQKNKEIYWFCTEYRYTDMIFYDWCENYCTADFKGRIQEGVLNINAFREAIRKMIREVRQ